MFHNNILIFHIKEKRGVGLTGYEGTLGYKTHKLESYDTFDYDTKKWINEVESLVGKTNIYIFPFGDAYGPSDRRLKYLIEQGFNVFCGVGSSTNIWFLNNAIVMDRLNLYGFNMNYAKERLKPLFDVDKVIDPVRPTFPKSYL